MNPLIQGLFPLTYTKIWTPNGVPRTIYLSVGRLYLGLNHSLSKNCLKLAHITPRLRACSGTTRNSTHDRGELGYRSRMLSEPRSTIPA